MKTEIRKTRQQWAVELRGFAISGASSLRKGQVPQVGSWARNQYNDILKCPSHWKCDPLNRKRASNKSCFDENKQRPNESACTCGYHKRKAKRLKMSTPVVPGCSRYTTPPKTATISNNLTVPSNSVSSTRTTNACAIKGQTKPIRRSITPSTTPIHCLNITADTNPASGGIGVNSTPPSNVTPTIKTTDQYSTKDSKNTTHQPIASSTEQIRVQDSRCITSSTQQMTKPFVKEPTKPIRKPTTQSSKASSQLVASTPPVSSTVDLSGNISKVYDTCLGINDGSETYRGRDTNGHVTNISDKCSKGSVVSSSECKENLGHSNTCGGNSTGSGSYNKDNEKSNMSSETIHGSNGTIVHDNTSSYATRMDEGMGKWKAKRVPSADIISDIANNQRIETARKSEVFFSKELNIHDNQRKAFKSKAVRVANVIIDRYMGDALKELLNNKQNGNLLTRQGISFFFGQNCAGTGSKLLRKGSVDVLESTVGSDNGTVKIHGMFLELKELMELVQNCVEVMGYEMEHEFNMVSIKLDFKCKHPVTGECLKTTDLKYQPIDDYTQIPPGDDNHSPFVMLSVGDKQHIHFQKYHYDRPNGDPIAGHGFRLNLQHQNGIVVDPRDFFPYNRDEDGCTFYRHRAQIVEEDGVAMTMCFSVGNHNVEVDPSTSCLTNPHQYQKQQTNEHFDMHTFGVEDEETYARVIHDVREKLFYKFHLPGQ